MRWIALVVVSVFALTGCNRRPATAVAGPGVPQPARAEVKASTLAEARRGFQTKLVRRESAGEPLPNPPADLFRRVAYDSPAGRLAAFLTPDPGDGRRHPAVIWITGGDCNTLDDGFWRRRSVDNDQTASGFREAGIPMLFPTLRGGNLNPGVREGFFGEVDDVLAAADFLAAQPFIDPGRMYLGGMSTGGTLALLAAASADRFRAVFAFGPADEMDGYDPALLPFDPADPREADLRSPIRWLHAMRSPTFVFEGAERGNVDSVRAMQRACTNPRVRFHLVAGADHVTVLAPTAGLIADKVLGDSGPSCNIEFTAAELNGPFAR